MNADRLYFQFDSFYEVPRQYKDFYRAARNEYDKAQYEQHDDLDPQALLAVRHAMEFFYNNSQNLTIAAPWIAAGPGEIASIGWRFGNTALVLDFKHVYQCRNPEIRWTIYDDTVPGGISAAGNEQTISAAINWISTYARGM